MQQTKLFIKLNKTIQVEATDVYLKDVAKCSCTDKTLLAKVRSLWLYSFPRDHTYRKSISILYIIEQLQKEFPQLDIENLGETEAVVTRGTNRDGKRIVKRGKGIRVILVCLICFFGTAFTIMAFHNDINITSLFSLIYQQITGQESSGYTALELFYSIGLTIGIIVFFNHFGTKRITKDPTPIEVEMKIYENDIYSAIVEDADENGETLECR